jgi:hypothetical protein
MIKAFSTVPREFDIKPRVPLWGKITLATTLCTWSPNELATLLSVITAPDMCAINFEMVKEVNMQRLEHDDEFYHVFDLKYYVTRLHQLNYANN